jgi:uncharacterized protein YbaP (TraB family)
LFATFHASGLDAQLLWKVSKGNDEKPSYLFGTIHIVPEKQFVVWPVVDSAFHASSKLVMEMDLELSASEMLQAAKQMSLPESKTLEAYIPKEKFERIRTYCIDSLAWKKRKFNRYCRMKPFFFSSLVLSAQLGKVKGYEQYFSSQAKRKKIPVLGLETLQQQMEALDAISIEEQAVALDESIVSGRAEYDKLLKVYLNRDLETLGKQMVENDEMMDDFSAELLTKRNKNWVPLLQKWMSENSIFVAVGAGHLPGEDGLINLLKREGYRVEPLY